VHCDRFCWDDSVAHAGTMTLWRYVWLIAIHLYRHRTCRENTGQAWIIASIDTVGLHQIPEICPTTEKVCGSSKFGKKYNDQS
jgi:hypothetical protein